MIFIIKTILHSKSKLTYILTIYVTIYVNILTKYL